LDKRLQDPAQLSRPAALSRPGTEKPVAEQGRIHFYKDHDEILPGVTALSAPGHTVSHTIFMINSGNQQLCYIGDLAHHQVLLLEHPRTQFAYDTDPAQSAESRVRMLDMLAANRIPLLAYHFPWPGIGHVTKRGEGFVYYPQPMILAQ
jgi:glyoxylase-like metal-dependent hydrolase (beta-lactamase superfamily II)